MEFKEVLLRRRTIRDFSTRPVAAGEIQEAVSHAFLAPSYNHLKQWYFLIVDDPEKKIRLTETEEMHDEVSGELEKAFRDHDPAAREMYLQAIPKQRKMILQAPLVIAAVYRPKTRVSEAVRVYDLNGLASIWCAIENFLLSLAEKDIFGVTFIPKNTDKVKKVLGIPEELEVAALIPVGYKQEGAAVPEPKKTVLEEHVKFNGWS